jgi:hypothetical protein
MKRVLLLITVASMLAAAMALSGVAQAAPINDSADAKCLKLTIKTLGPSFNPSNYTFIGGTEGNDSSFLGEATDVPDVFCGFGGADGGTHGTLDEGDIFLGGEGDDYVGANYGTIYGQEGNDRVLEYNYGKFYGGAGNDFVPINYYGATFYGEEGVDAIFENYGDFFE